MPAKPLDGIRVVDFTRLFAGPFCTMQLADLGADVVKVEAPEGDPIRLQGPPFVDGNSMGFLAVNRNKRSICMDMKDPAQREAVRQLIEMADVVVENFRPGVMERFGMAPGDFADTNPGLIYARISGMGATGPLRDKGAFDLTMQAEAGFMSITGEPDGGPIKLGTSVFDLVCGQYLMGAIMTSLYQREKTGRGALVETSLFESVITFLADAGMEWLTTGGLRPRLGSEHSSMVPYRAFRTQDGWVAIGAAVQPHFEKFVTLLGLEALIADPRFRDLRGRVDNRKALDALLDPVVSRFTTEALVTGLDQLGIPCAPVNTIDKAFAHPQSLARDMRVEVPGPDGSTLPMIGAAVKYSGFEITDGWRAPPRLGADTEAVLAEWLGHQQTRNEERTG